MIDPFLMNGGNLSYIGDAYYELIIRKYLLGKGVTNQKKLHQTAVKYVSAASHKLIIDKLKSEFTDQEMDIYRRGRNQKNQSHRKNLDSALHNESSGFEAVIGYLYLKEEYDRLEYLINKAIEIVED